MDRRYDGEMVGGKEEDVGETVPWRVVRLSTLRFIATHEKERERWNVEK